MYNGGETPYLSSLYVELRKEGRVKIFMYIYNVLYGINLKGLPKLQSQERKKYILQHPTDQMDDMTMS